MKKIFISLFLAIGVISSGCAKSDTNANKAQKYGVEKAQQNSLPVDLKQLKTSLNKQLTRLGPNISAKEILTVKGWNDLFQVVLSNGQIVYTKSDAQFIVIGSVLDLQQPKVTDLTSVKEQELSAQSLKNIDRKELIIYPAQGKKRASIYAFTDVSCPYCHYVHKEVADLNKQGIEVIYLAYPRAGLQGNTYQTMSDIWCAKDRHQALDMALADKKIEKSKKSCKSIIEKHFKLGQSIGVRGTPAIYTAQGKQIGGYLKVDKALQALALKAR